MTRRMKGPRGTGPTSSDPDVVTIDGVQFRWTDRAHMGLNQRLKVDRALLEVQPLLAQLRRRGELSPATEARATDLLMDLCRLVIPAPPALVARLSPVQALELVVLYTLRFGFPSRLPESAPLGEADRDRPTHHRIH